MIMVLVVLGSILLTRNLKVDHISKRQAVLEMAYTAGKNFFEGLLGKEGACYVPYLMTVAIYIACSNLTRRVRRQAPTKDLDVTAALALMSIVLIEGSGIRARGGVGFLKSLAAPTPVMTPMNILEIAIRLPAVHATVRQRAGRIRHHGADQAGGAVSFLPCSVST